MICRKKRILDQCGSFVYQLVTRYWSSYSRCVHASSRGDVVVALAEHQHHELALSGLGFILIFDHSSSIFSIVFFSCFSIILAPERLLLWPSVGGPSTMALQSSPLDDPASFRALMIECHMPSIQIEHIVTSGYTTIALLAHGVHDESKMEEFVEYLSVVPAGETFSTFSPRSASIRRVLKECISRCVQSGRDSNTETSAAPLVKSKLSMADVKTLRADFCQNYPGELLTPQSMPSLSFLSILKEAIDGNCLAWVPWKNRTSESDEQAFLEHRRPRN